MQAPPPDARQLRGSAPGRRFAVAIAVAFMVTLAGCASIPSEPVPADTSGRDLPHAFELQARISATDGTQAVSGRLEWMHTAHGDTWTMRSPLGQVLGELTSDRHGALLRTADGALLTAPSADAILPELLGMEAPVDALPHWVHAVPRPGARVLDRDPEGRPSRISDAGWIIDYAQYPTADAHAPPRRIDIHRGDNRLRLIVDQWDLLQ